jgi:predicted porin
MAQSVTVYGRLALTANQIETGSSTKLRELRDNASRRGFGGAEDLGRGMQGPFGLEMGLSARRSA